MTASLPPSVSLNDARGVSTEPAVVDEDATADDNEEVERLVTPEADVVAQTSSMAKYASEELSKPANFMDRVFRFAGLVWSDSHRRVGVDPYAAQSMLMQTVLFEVSKHDQVSRRGVLRECSNLQDVEVDSRPDRRPVPQDVGLQIAHGTEDIHQGSRAGVHRYSREDVDSHPQHAHSRGREDERPLWAHRRRPCCLPGQRLRTGSR